MTFVQRVDRLCLCTEYLLKITEHTEIIPTTRILWAALYTKTEKGCTRAGEVAQCAKPLPHKPNTQIGFWEPLTVEHTSLEPCPATAGRREWETGEWWEIYRPASLVCEDVPKRDPVSNNMENENWPMTLACVPTLTRVHIHLLNTQKKKEGKEKNLKEKKPSKCKQ